MSDPLNGITNGESKDQSAIDIEKTDVYRSINKIFIQKKFKTLENLKWLFAHIHPYFFITMKEDLESIVDLAANLHNIPRLRKHNLLDRDGKLIIACEDIPGSLYNILKTIKEREISYAELTHSVDSIPGSRHALEIQRYEFDKKNHEDIRNAGKPDIPPKTRKSVTDAIKVFYPEYDFSKLDQDLNLLWFNNSSYIRISPAERTARILWLFYKVKEQNGLYLDVEAPPKFSIHPETRLLFAVESPPQKGFLTQISEVFQRLDIGVMRSYCLNISSGTAHFFLGTFYVTSCQNALMDKGSDVFRKLQVELYNTQILTTSEMTYTSFVANGIMTGEEASLTNAFEAFCHTSLAHNQPDRFDLETVKNAFMSDPDTVLKLICVFRNRFSPDIKDRERVYNESLNIALSMIEDYNTGHKYLDMIRKTVFKTCLLFISHTLKTNFFVPVKHALAFRLDPAYLNALGPEFISDLPQTSPFRVTFFFGRHASGYHIGFSDIARGGWRTIISTNQDDYTTASNTLFREVFVLAHTQHLKNKDIYEGGSKLTMVLNAEGLEPQDDITQRLQKMQFGFINAFLDIFVTKNGIAVNPCVIDYYGDEEPIELGPDENMHDAMIEMIAQQSVKRNYLLGVGLISSKKAGINHKEYGVTSRGVIKFSEIAMKNIGIDMHKDLFSVKITGGTNGDVAGNAMRLLLDRCPHVKILSIVAGKGALYDPEGADKNELNKHILKNDITDFSPEKLHPGGYILYKNERHKDGIRELYKKIYRTGSEIIEDWVTTDEFFREFNDLIFSVKADIFLPCGGRPETIDVNNCNHFFDKDGIPTAKIISEGANSYITPGARDIMQKRGVILLRDASANKCGVISSSYEIIANLIMTEKEFLKNKSRYVKDVLKILDKRAEDEINLILKRFHENEGKLLYTEISLGISVEINNHYARLFDFFKGRPHLLNQPVFKRIILNHLPVFISESAKYKKRIKDLPQKIKYAILASEIASYIVYNGGWEFDLESQLKEYFNKQLI